MATRFTGYWYADDQDHHQTAPLPGPTVQVVMNDGSIVQVAAGPCYKCPQLDVLDVSEAVVKYLRGNLGASEANNLPIHRLTVKRWPTINPYSFRQIQPLRGASAALPEPVTTKAVVQFLARRMPGLLVAPLDQTGGSLLFPDSRFKDRYWNLRPCAETKNRLPGIALPPIPCGGSPCAG